MGQVFPERRGLEDCFDLIIRTIKALPRASTQSACVGFQGTLPGPQYHREPLSRSGLQSSLKSMQTGLQNCWVTPIPPTTLLCKNMHWVLNFDTWMLHLKLSSCLLRATKTILSRRHYALISQLSGSKQFCINSVLNWQQQCWVQYLWQKNNCQDCQHLETNEALNGAQC